LFSGNPNWDLLQQQKKCSFTEEEQAFLDGPTEELCSLLDDWKITFIQRDLSEEIWQFIKKINSAALLFPKNTTV
jgi:hypothetical protein